MEIDLQRYWINSIEVNPKAGCIAFQVESNYEPDPSNPKDDWENLKRHVLFKGVAAYQLSGSLNGSLWSVSEIPIHRLSELAPEFWVQIVQPELLEIAKANVNESAVSDKRVFRFESEYGFDAYIVSSSCEINEAQDLHSK